MKFNSKTGAIYGRKSKRGEDKDKKHLRDVILKLLKENEEKFTEELNKLQGTAFIDRFLNILEYALPKMRRTEIIEEEEIGTPVDFSKVSDATLKELMDAIDDQS